MALGLHHQPGRIRLALAVGVLLLLGIVSAGCGGAGVAGPSHSAASNQGGGASSPGATTPQYLIKSLAVDMQVKDTRRVAIDLQNWVATTDPRSTTAGIDYEQTDDGLYRVSVTFAVQASLYPQIQRYLADYAGQHDGTLVSLHETVQDVTNDYIDTQSRLANLRAEQQRLQDLLKQATSLNEVLSIDQRLTDVEGQIESTEAHLNALNGQTTFYRVTVSLEPISNPVAVASNQFDPGGTLINAARAALVFGEFLLTVLIWLLVFSVFLLPVLPIWLLVRRYRRTRRTRPTRPAPPPPSFAPARIAAPVPVTAPPSAPSAPPAGVPPAPPPGPSA